MSGPVGIRWTDSYTGNESATGIITADMRGPFEGWSSIAIGNRYQRITLVARPRHFGGRQWFFVCPYLNRRAMVLWMPPGARDFSCRQRWQGRVAYASQFASPDDRAHGGKDKIKRRLCEIGGFDPEEWELPPKPKWMRWRTYNRAVEKFDGYEDILDEHTIRLVARFMAD